MGKNNIRQGVERCPVGSKGPSAVVDTWGEGSLAGKLIFEEK